MRRIEEKLIGSLYRLNEKIIYVPFIQHFEDRITKFSIEKDEKYKKFLNSDLHIHSIYSDGVNTPDHIARVAKRRTLEIIAITDHNTYIHWSSCKAAIQKYNIVVVPGIEVSTGDGHLICLFPNYQVDRYIKKLTELSPTLYAEEAIDLTHNSNGVAIAAHVGKTNSISLRRLGELKSLDGIEEFNPAAGLFNPTIADKFGKAETGGSDSHWKVSIGVAQTLFPEKDKILSYKPNLKKVLEEIVECIRKKRTESYYLPLTFFEYSVDKLRWLSSFYSFKSIVEFFNDKEKIIAKNIEKSLIE